MVFGDLSLEPDPPRAWRDYYGWRKSMGEPRVLHDAPGHLFESGERDDLAKVVAWANHGLMKQDVVEYAA